MHGDGSGAERDFAICGGAWLRRALDWTSSSLRPLPMEGEEADPVVPKGWVVKYSQSKEPGRPYYVRISDGHRQWDPPNDYNWEVIVAVVILAAVGLYPSSGDPGDSSSLRTHGGCTCAPYSYDGDRQVGAGCIPDGGGGATGWCDVEPGCAAAKDATQDNDGWDTCTPAFATEDEYYADYADAAGNYEYDGAAAAAQGGVPAASLETAAEGDAGNWSGDDPPADPAPEAAAPAQADGHDAILVENSAAPPDAGGAPRRCSDMDPCPDAHTCELDEQLDYAVCVYTGAPLPEEDESLLSMFQAKAGTPVQLQRADTEVADAVRAKVKEDPEAVRAGAAAGEPLGDYLDSGAAHGRPHSRTPTGHGHGQAAAGGRGSVPSGRPKGRPQSREEMKARAEAAARAREAATAAERERKTAEREAEVAAETAAQAKFEHQMTTVAAIARWAGAALAWLIIFESSPSLHNGFYQLCVWVLCITHCFIALGGWLVASMRTCCGRASLVHSEDSGGVPGGGNGHGNDSSLSVLSVIVVPASGESVPWRSVYRHLMEQTSEHDRTEIIFVCAASAQPAASDSGEWAADLLHRMPKPSCRLQPQLVTYEPGPAAAFRSSSDDGVDEIEAFRAGAAHATGGCVLLVPSDALLPAGYDRQVREALLSDPEPYSFRSHSYTYTYAGTFRFGVYPRALSMQIQQAEQAIERLENRSAAAAAAAAAAATAVADGRHRGRQLAPPVSVGFFSSPAAATAAALESELITRRQHFGQLIR
jgi:hypothetical protein